MNTKMSVPFLRRPKITNKSEKKSQNDFMILTLKNGNKLVVTSDSFHGILASDLYKCVLCRIEMDFNYGNKETHKTSKKHKKMLSLHPHMEEFAENLIRELGIDTCYCTICSVSMASNVVKRHINADGHTVELNKAKVRSFNYQPF